MAVHCKAVLVVVHCKVVLEDMVELHKVEFEGKVEEHKVGCCMVGKQQWLVEASNSQKG